MPAVLVFLLLLLFFLSGLLLLALHFGFRAPRNIEQGSPADFGIDYEEIEIPGPKSSRLFGWWLPAENASSSLILLHGWGGNAELMLPLAQPFYRAGINLLLFDARNHGRSDRQGHSSLPRFAEDLHHAIDWLRREHPDACGGLALLGHSVGAGAVLFTAAQRHDIDAVIAIAPFTHPERVLRRSLARWHLPEFLLRLILRYVEWLIGHRFDEIAPINTVCRISVPVLLVHGDADQTVPLEDARDIIAACPRPNLTLLVIPGADHDSVELIDQHAPSLIEFLRNNRVYSN